MEKEGEEDGRERGNTPQCDMYGYLSSPDNIKLSIIHTVGSFYAYLESLVCLNTHLEQC